MIFHFFATHEGRRTFGGSAFLELQHCYLPAGTPVRKIFSSVDYWRTDSLYVHVDDIDTFYKAYINILGNGIYQNGANGPPDIYGINYYPPEKTKIIVRALQKKTTAGI